MSAIVLRKATPEEDELERKSRELLELEAELVAREVELATLSAELQEFELECLESVGPRYAELDRLEAKMAEVQAATEPLDELLSRHVDETRARAQRSSEEVGSIKEKAPELRREETEDLKKLYRDIAKTIHPDLTEDEDSHEIRSKLMAEANAAYKRGDKEALNRILADWQCDEHAVFGDDIAHQLVKVIRRSARIRLRMQRIQEEVAALISSELAQLRNRVQEARLRGRDLLSELACRLDGRIAGVRDRLSGIEERKDERQSD
jgi:hypothetical protein